MLVYVITKQGQMPEDLIIYHTDPNNRLPGAHFSSAHPVEIKDLDIFNHPGEPEEELYRIRLEHYRWPFSEDAEYRENYPQYLITSDGVLRHSGNLRRTITAIMERKQEYWISVFECEEKEKKKNEV